MHLPDVPAEVFSMLHDFERAAKSGRGNQRRIWVMLQRVGKTLGEMLTPEQQAGFEASRTITAFTDFPWGLAILPGDTAPVSMRVPIAYRPLTPLTRALQFEFSPLPTIYLAGGFSVLIAECIEDSDHIRAQSECGWRKQMPLLTEQGAGKVRCRFEIVGCLADLHHLLDEDSYDVLVLSAHGISDGRISGLRIGKDNVFDLGHALPPIVVFSACEVWPRGRGVISIADLALRWGAMTILGTLVPINVDHNAFVIMRIFLYIVESLHRREPHLTFADAITRALATNAVIDVLHGSPRMKRWGFTTGPNGEPPPLTEFMDKRANGQLRASHVYEDTERVLCDIAEGHGLGYARYVRNFFINKSYIPESLYYVMIGCPEKVVLQPRVPVEEVKP